MGLQHTHSSVRLLSVGGEELLEGPVPVTGHSWHAQGAFDSFAMGNYPYPTYYIGGSAEHPLPAFPMRTACSHLGGSYQSDQELMQVSRTPAEPMLWPPGVY